MVQASLKTAHQFQKWHVKLKMAQAIFLPGAWGKIPVFMGKNYPTPGAAMAFFYAKNYPPKSDFSDVQKIF